MAAAKVKVRYKEKIALKEVARIYGELEAASGEKIYAREMKLKTINTVSLLPEVLHRIAAAHVGSPGSIGNYFIVRITNTGTSGPSIEATGSHKLYFTVVGE